ncbi:MAG: phosphotransferase [Burkholderiaceae bacterium]
MDPLAAALDLDRLREPICEALRQWGFDTPRRVTVERVHFGKRGATVVQYRCDDLHGDPHLTLHGVPTFDDPARVAADESQRLRKSRRAQAHARDPDPVVPLPGSPLTIRLAGRDAALPGLRLLRDPMAVRDMMDRIGEPVAGDTEVATRLHAHRLGKRAVLSLDGRHGHDPRRRFLRLAPVSHPGARLRFDQHRRIAAALRSGRTAASVNVPTPIAFDDVLGVAVFDALPGAAASDPDHAWSARIDAGLTILAGLAALGGVEAPRHDARKELSLLLDWQTRLARWRPELASPFEGRVRQLFVDFSGLAQMADSPCHRDLHEGQMLLGPDGPGLLDFDTFCLSDPDLDAGNLLAHLRWRECLEDSPGVDAADEFARRLEHRCGSARWSRIAFWARVSFLRVLAIHAFATDTEETVQDLLLGSAL